MGDTDLRAETREKVKKETVTKIHGQPIHTDPHPLLSPLMAFGHPFPATILLLLSIERLLSVFYLMKKYGYKRV
jgi:hypothetical protein